MKIILAFPFAILLFMASCTGIDPIPQEKEVFVGVWVSPAGFQLQIMPEGVAHVYQPYDSTNPEYKQLAIEEGNAVYNFGFEIQFQGDSLLQLVKPYLGKQYRLERYPYKDGDTLKMTLNGIDLVKQDELHQMEEM